jgi:hypothetical protein
MSMKFPCGLICELGKSIQERDESERNERPVVLKEQAGLSYSLQHCFHFLLSRTLCMLHLAFVTVDRCCACKADLGLLMDTEDSFMFSLQENPGACQLEEILWRGRKALLPEK